mmetsp:Transcript_23409/g.38239  ORF Transcript_23409/g.38239 Transcript_23409/m.38239 type:complete len:141 (-) Transcript_23409:674-1096(-)
MSSIPDDNDDNNFLEKIKNYSLPPAPEDPIALGTFGGHNWLAIHTIEISYAPAIAPLRTSGLASDFVSIATSWLLCGYFTGVFLNSNTLHCTATNTKALGVTLRTWMCTAILMVVLALGVVGWDECVECPGEGRFDEGEC